MTCYLLHAGQPSAQRLLKRVSNLKLYVSSSAVQEGDVIIRWGEVKEADPFQAYQVLNPQAAVARTASRAAMGKFLRRFGVRFFSKDNSSDAANRMVRHYRIPLFDLQPIACFRADTGAVWINQRIQRVQDSFREVAQDEDRVTVRAVRLAARTLHTLGLDHGMVSVAMGPKGVLHVLDVTPAPLLKGRMLDLFAQAVEEFIERDADDARESGAPFLLGTDVEIMLRNAQGKMVLASNYLSRKGRVGCDDRSVQFDGKRLPLMELRPDPDSTPLGLLSKLRDTMLEATRLINRANVEWRAGSMPFRQYSVGGHIHFSNVPFSSRFVRVLDNYVGLPLMMVEDPRTARQRRPKYGFLGDVRHKDYGGFEYRTPASFVLSPEVTAAAFCLAYAVSLHHRELPVTDLYDETIQAAFMCGQVDVLRPIVEHNISSLRGVQAYEQYREHIDPLFNMILEDETWEESADVRLAWGIPIQARRSTGQRRVKKSSQRVRV